MEAPTPPNTPNWGPGCRGVSLGYLEGGLRLEILARYTIYIYNSIPSQNLKSLAPLKVLQTDPPTTWPPLWGGQKKIWKNFYWLIQLAIPRSGEKCKKKCTTTFFSEKFIRGYPWDIFQKKNQKYFYWLIQLEILRSGENFNKKSTTTFFSKFFSPPRLNRDSGGQFRGLLGGGQTWDFG